MTGSGDVVGVSMPLTATVQGFRLKSNVARGGGGAARVTGFRSGATSQADLS